VREEHRELNRRWWDERVPIHTASEFYDVEAFKAGGSTLRPFELEEVGDVAGKRLLHLQCHFGLDTLSWARRGASVVGLDFSEPAVEAANRLAWETGLDGTFVAADLHDAEAALGSQRFDIVYTGLGALNWLPDLRRWAEVVGSLLHRPRVPLPGRVPPVHGCLRRRQPDRRRGLLPRPVGGPDRGRRRDLRRPHRRDRAQRNPRVEASGRRGDRGGARQRTDPRALP
jgi:hypothetical protein